MLVSRISWPTRHSDNTRPTYSYIRDRSIRFFEIINQLVPLVASVGGAVERDHLRVKSGQTVVYAELIDAMRRNDLQFVFGRLFPSVWKNDLSIWITNSETGLSVSSFDHLPIDVMSVVKVQSGEMTVMRCK